MFLMSTILSLLYLICAICININWINDIACYLGYFLSIYLVLFIALIPGFIFVFMLISLLLRKKEKKTTSTKEEDVTILIPVYNAKKTIKETIESIRKQKYCGNIYVNIIDDGSTDGSLELLKKDGILIIETDEEERELKELEKLQVEVYDLRKYGRVHLIFLNRKE